MSQQKLSLWKKEDEEKVTSAVSKLRFISKLKTGEIVDVQTLSTSEKGWLTSAYRTFVTREESRNNTLTFFSTVIDDSIQIIYSFLENNNRYNNEYINIIISELERVESGLINHSKTYNSDKMYTSRVETLIKTLNTKIDQIKNHQYNNIQHERMEKIN